MAKRKEKKRELTPREWQDKFCAMEGHEMAALVIKGRAKVVCFECDAYWLRMDIRGYTPHALAARHYTVN